MDKLEFIKTRLPLVVDMAELSHSSSLSMKGRDKEMCAWSFRSIADPLWRFIQFDGEMISRYGKMDAEIEEDFVAVCDAAIKLTVGHRIIDVFPQSKYYHDPTFLFDDKSVLEFFSIQIQEAEWVMHFETADGDVLVYSNRSTVEAE